MTRDRYEMPRGEDAPQRGEGTVTEELDGEAIVYSECTGDVHVLNATATLIWQHLDGQVTLDDLARDLSEVFLVPFAQVQADVLQVARTLAEDGLLDTRWSSQVGVPSDGMPTADVAAPPLESGFLPKPPPG